MNYFENKELNNPSIFDDLNCFVSFINKHTLTQEEYDLLLNNSVGKKIFPKKEIISLLIQLKSNVQYKNRWGLNTFQYACLNENISIEILEILEKGVNIHEKDSFNRTCIRLMCESVNPNPDLIDHYCQKWIDLNSFAFAQESTFHFATQMIEGLDQSSYNRICRSMIDYQGNPNLKEKSKNRTPFHFVCQNNLGEFFFFFYNIFFLYF